MLRFFVELFLIAQAHADPLDGGCNFRTGDAHFDCIPTYLAMYARNITKFGGSFALLMLMWNGIRYMVGPITEGSADAAKRGISYSLIGLAICLLVYIIIETIVYNVTQ